MPMITRYTTGHVSICFCGCSTWHLCLFTHSAHVLLSCFCLQTPISLPTCYLLGWFGVNNLLTIRKQSHVFVYLVQFHYQFFAEITTPNWTYFCASLKNPHNFFYFRQSVYFKVRRYVIGCIISSSELLMRSSYYPDLGFGQSFRSTSDPIVRPLLDESAISTLLSGIINL